MKPLSPMLVADLWDAATAKYDTRLATEADTPKLDHFLADQHVLDPAKYKANHAVTIGKVIFLPFRPGFPHPIWDLWQQVYICGHEHQHVWQANQQEGVLYQFTYWSDSTKRAYYETECFRVAMALAWHFNQVMLEPATLAAKLREYGCNEDDVQMGEKILTLSADSIRSGALPGEVCRFIAGWLDTHMV